MDPLPSVNIVLFTTTLTPTQSPVTCFVQASFKNLKKDRSTCAYCGVLDPLKEKCFKLHVYPPGYNKPQSFRSFNQANNDNDNGSTNNDYVRDKVVMTPHKYQ